MLGNIQNEALQSEFVQEIWRYPYPNTEYTGEKDLETRMTQLPPWSYSMLESFESCNRKAFHTYILKEKGPKTAAMEEGNKFDDAIERRIRDGKPLPPEYQKYEPLAASVANTGNRVYTQLKLGIKRDFTSCTFFDKDVWGRGVLDIYIVDRQMKGEFCGINAIINDWKTGKNNEGKSYSNDGLQLKIFTALLFKTYPGLEKITAFNTYVNVNPPIGKPYVFTRADERVLWQEILPKVMAMEKACAEESWPEKQGPLCGYCPVKQCQYNRS